MDRRRCARSSLVDLRPMGCPWGRCGERKSLSVQDARPNLGCLGCKSLPRDVSTFDALGPWPADLLCGEVLAHSQEPCATTGGAQLPSLVSGRPGFAPRPHHGYRSMKLGYIQVLQLKSSCQGSPAAAGMH